MPNKYNLNSVTYKKRKNMRDRKQEEIEKWKIIIKEFHDSRKDMLFDDMDNTDFCKFMTENFEAPNKLPVFYDPKFGDDRICECGHAYYRHFDSYEDMEPVGCKYCRCYQFKERA